MGKRRLQTNYCGDSSFEPIAAYSHDGLVDIANRINRLVPKPDEEREET